MPFLVPTLGGGPFGAMRKATLDLVSSAVSQFYPSEGTDRAHLGYTSMGCVHPGRQAEDYDNFVVTNWKAQDSAHIVHQGSASAPSSGERRDGAHILSSWTAHEGSDVSSSTAQEEEVPSYLEPTPLVPGAYLSLLI